MKDVYVLCRNIMEYSEQDVPPYELAWTDPPWQERMTKFFNTILRKQTGEVCHNTYDEIITQLARITHTERPLYVEHGLRGYEHAISLITAQGHSLTRTQEAVQLNKNPYVILCFNTSIFPEPGLKGFESTRNVVRQYPAKSLVFDPFAGMGLTARAVVEGGGRYFGSEYNPLRCDKLEAVAQELNS